MKKLYTAIVLSLILNTLAAQKSAEPDATGIISPLSSEKRRAGEAYSSWRTSIPRFLHSNSINDKINDAETSGQQGFSLMLVPSTGTDYDVKYYRLELRINPDTSIGKYIKGIVTTYFTTNLANFSQINFDFATPLNCDSVYYHGAKMAAGNISRTTDLLNITIPPVSAAGTLDSVSVYYRGVPPVVPYFGNGTGFVKSTHGASQNYIYTLSEPYSSCTWWPCKSYVVNDKADSVDLIISTPAGFKAAGNGTLVSETTVGFDVITVWKERYPLSAYQVAVGVANYVQYPSIPTIVNIGGTNMPLYNYIFPETNTVNAQTSLDRTGLMLTTFSNKFGDYPFKNEKYGHYTFGFGGGMEHNTFSGMNAATYNAAGAWEVIAHELGHQWFGASVTCGSWRDIWINESFATFTESVCAEFAPSVTPGATGVSQRAKHKGVAINAGNQTQTISVADTSNIATIFSPSVYIYQRGAMVLYMLRSLLGDTKFFDAVKNYQSDPLLKYGNAVTADVKRHMENASGLDLTTFFNQWIYNTGFASYSGAKWNSAGNQIVLLMPQTTQSSALPHFDMPLVVRVQGSNPVTMDTSLVLYDQNGSLSFVNNAVLTPIGSNLFQLNLSFAPTTVSFDPFAQTLASGSFAKDPSLALLADNNINFSGRKSGNDALLSWDVNPSFGYFSFELQKSADAAGFKTVAHFKSADYPGKYVFSHTDTDISYGTTYYRIKLMQQNGSIIYSKIIAIGNADAAGRFTLTPNPVAGNEVNIKWAGENAVMIDAKIFDVNGKLVKKASRSSISPGNNWKIPVAGVQAGNYFIEVETGNKQKSIQKVVIIK
jgi:Peptidase family M1 domain/Secretion system C-terminal sorting domain